MKDIALLVRMLPWLVAHPGASTTQVAERFEISKQKVWSLLNLLVFTGPSQYGGGLVDIALDDEDYLQVIEAQNLDRAIRLTPSEAAALVGGLRFLKTIGPDLDIAAIDALIAKLVPAASEVPIVVDVISDTEDDALVQQISKSISDKGTLEIEYASASQGTLTARVIEPTRLTTLEDRRYVEGWCQHEELYRAFRIDRIVSLKSSAQPRVSELEVGELPAYKIRAKVLVSPGRLGQIEPGAIVESSEQADGRLELTIEINSLRWLAGVVIASAGQVQALEPLELRELICEMIAVGTH
jgi:proteasome accessory factor C